MTARQSGLPGLSATPCATMPGSASSATTRYDRSPAPLRRAAREQHHVGRRQRLPSAARSAPASSGTIPSGTGSPPSSRTASARTVRVAVVDRAAADRLAGRRPARRRWRGSRPAAGATTDTRPRPIAASTPVSRQVSTSPARSTVSPRPMSVPAKVTFGAGRDGARDDAARRRDTSVCSIITTASAPARQHPAGGDRRAPRPDARCPAARRRS